MGTMKRLLMVLAAVFATASASALAGDLMESKTATLASKAVQMTDEQLDDITAAERAFVAIVINNPGNAMDLRRGDHKVMCINCGLSPISELVVINKGHPMSDPLIKCLGRCP